jgi:FkbM family methyltransferase
MNRFHIFVKKVISQLEQLALKREIMSIVSIINSVRATLDDKRLTFVYFDGEDWVYRWFGGALVLDNAKYCPRPKLSRDIPLFSQHYLIREGDIAIDAGAGVGTEIPWLSKGVGDLGRVFAIEADSIAVRRLNKLISLNNFKNVTVLQMALWNENNSLSWNRDSDEGLRNSISRSSETENFVIGITLNELLKSLDLKVINFFKMNIEGAEKEALEAFTSGETLIKNWCISCHDFIGLSTSDFIEKWFMKSKYEMLPNGLGEIGSCESFYRYAKLND